MEDHRRCFRLVLRHFSLVRTFGRLLVRMSNCSFISHGMFVASFGHLFVPSFVSKEQDRTYGLDRIKEKKTRPDTRPPVADGWAGAEMRVFPLFDSIITDGRTDGRTKPLIELRVRN